MRRIIPKGALGQDSRGYRYNHDSFLLADFFRPRTAGMVADFCAGAGVVSILIGARWPELKVTAVELNVDMALMARANAVAAGLGGYRALAGDVMDAPNLFRGRPFSAIVSNPPYRKAGRGKLNPDLAKAQARHEIRMNLAGLVSAAGALLIPGGVLTIVMLMERLDEYRALLGQAGFGESRIREVRHRPSSQAKIFLSEAILGERPDPRAEPPFILAGEDGWSDEYMEMMSRYAP